MRFAWQNLAEKAFKKAYYETTNLLKYSKYLACLRNQKYCGKSRKVPEH